MQPALLDWMKLLPVDSSKLRLNELRNLKQLHSFIQCKDLHPSSPRCVKYAFQSFRRLYLFAFLLIHEKRFPALNRCWDDLQSRYKHDFIFQDATTAESWIFFNFPITKTGRTVLDEFEDSSFVQDQSEMHLKPFIESAKKSRLGLYQEILSTSQITKMSELFTNKVVSTMRSVSDYQPGEIFLGRLIEINGEPFLFGNPFCFPGNRREDLLMMIKNKLVFYGSEESESQDYEQFMRYTGPYWMSIVSNDENGEILSPDHWEGYHEEDELEFHSK